MKTIKDLDCTIYAGDGSLSQLQGEVARYLAAEPNAKCVVLCENAAAKKIFPVLLQACPPLRRCKRYFLPASESRKHIETLLPLWEQWANDKLDRKTLVINLGGGVLCDMGGFAASLFKRGLPYINIPTTLLAMADASAGGKTAVDLGEIKNILGCFNRPRAVFADPVFLKTLPEREMLSGMAEILKMQCICRTDFSVQRAEKIFTDPEYLNETLLFAIKNKALITQQDFKEENIRKTLNFGHTFGHAFEALALRRKRPISHGEAVAHGMVCELYLSCRKCGFTRARFESFAKLINARYGSFTYTEKDIPALLNYMVNDKKNKGRKIYPVLLSDWGKCVFDKAVLPVVIEKTLHDHLTLKY